MTTHEHERVIGVLSGDPLWDRDNPGSFWGRGRQDGYYDRKFRPGYWDLIIYQFVPTTDPAEVAEYRLGHTVGQDEKKRKT